MDEQFDLSENRSDPPEPETPDAAPAPQEPGETVAEALLAQTPDEPAAEPQAPGGTAAQAAPAEPQEPDGGSRLPVPAEVDWEARREALRAWYAPDYGPEELTYRQLGYFAQKRFAFPRLCAGLLLFLLGAQAARTVLQFLVMTVRGVIYMLDGGTLENLYNVILSVASDNTLLLVLNDVAMYGVGLPLLWLCVRRLPRPAAALYGQKTRLGFGGFLGYLCVSVAGILTFAQIGMYFDGFLSGLTGTDVTDALSALAGDLPLWAAFPLLCVVAPLGEEFVFRKLLFDRALPYGERAAVVFTAVAFGLLHGNLSQFFYATALGLIFGYIVLKTRNVWYTILLHGLVNLVSGFLPLALEDYTLPAAAYYLATGALLTAGLLLFLRRAGGVQLAPSRLLPEKGLLRAVFANPFGIIYIVFCLYSALLIVFYTAAVPWLMEVLEGFGGMPDANPFEMFERFGGF